MSNLRVDFPLLGNGCPHCIRVVFSPTAPREVPCVAEQRQDPVFSGVISSVYFWH